MFINKLPSELILQILNNLDIKELEKSCKLNKKLYQLCEKYTYDISSPYKKFLKEHQVDYKDDNNFIYNYNGISRKNFISRQGRYNYRGIYKLYMKNYYDENIVAQNLNIPIYGVNLPNHFILAYMDEFGVRKFLPEENKHGVLFYINPFSKGTVFDEIEIKNCSL